VTQPDKGTGAPSESLAAALAHIQSKLPRVDKAKTATVQTKTGGSYSYDYADLAAVSAVVLPLLGDAGLSWLTKPTLIDGKLILAYKLLHVSGDVEEGQYPLPQSGSPQEIGSAITYARRYCLCSVTGVAPEEDDDDGAAASAGSRPKTAQRRPAGRQAERSDPGPQQARPTPRTAQRTAQPQGPPLPGEAGYDQPTPLESPSLITSAQQKKLHATLADLNCADRDRGLRLIGVIVGRPIESTKELTKDETTGLIDTLAQMTAESVADLIADESEPSPEDLAAINAEAAAQTAENATR